jgi:hypothetical protein
MFGILMPIHIVVLKVMVKQRADDILYDRPPLSQFHDDYKADYKARIREVCTCGSEIGDVLLTEREKRGRERLGLSKHNRKYDACIQL